MNKKRAFCFSLCAVLLAAVQMGYADDDVFKISVSNDRTRAQPIVIVPFKQDPSVTTDVAQVIDDDLSRSGMFTTMPRSDMTFGQPGDVSEVSAPDWKRFGNNVVIGKVVPGSAPGSIDVSFTLIDVLHGDTASVVMNGSDILGRDKAHQRSAAHQAADMIFQKLTGIRGVFNTQIAYINSSGTGNNRRFQLFICDADGYAGSQHTIATSHEPLMSPAWSPDGRKLAFVGYDRGYSAIYVQTWETGELKKFVGEKGINGAPAWSPDGTKLAVTLSFERNPDIYVIDVATGARTRITTDPGIDTEATWSPDGQTLVWTSDRGGLPQLYMAPATGGAQTRLTFQGNRNEDPSFSPDGKLLALVNSDGSGYHIGLMDWQTRAIKIISDGSMDEHPRFAPNSQVLIYTSQGSRGEELRTATVDGRVHQALSQPGNVREPAWGPFPPGNQ
jgi:TolB protein